MEGEYISFGLTVAPFLLKQQVRKFIFVLDCCSREGEYSGLMGSAMDFG